MSGTLIFCTTHAGSADRWHLRNRQWLNAVRQGALHHDHILLVDDGSPLLPGWPDVSVQVEPGAPLTTKDATLFHFRENLGRQGVAVYPGWYRSFCFAGQFAERHGFSKVVHIESDAYIITRRMQDAINAVADGWIAPAILSHAMPESSIQIIAGQSVADFIAFTRRPYNEIAGLEAEHFLPFTGLERGFVGSRYGETLDYVPRDADFVTQTHPERISDPNYLWWLPPN